MAVFVKKHQARGIALSRDACDRILLFISWYMLQEFFLEQFEGGKSPMVLFFQRYKGSLSFIGMRINSKDV